MFSIDLRESTPNTNTRSELAAATSTLPHLADKNYTCHKNNPYKENCRNGQPWEIKHINQRKKIDLKLNKQVKWMHTLLYKMLGLEL
jgi:hypothetical protein